MSIDPRWPQKLATYPHVVVSWVGDDGYPMQTAASFALDEAAPAVRLGPTAVPLPTDREVNVVASHIRPQPATGYDQRRYISLWGRLTPAGEGMVLRPERTWGWDEAEVPFFEYSERSNRQAGRYLAALSAERGHPVKPRLPLFWTFFLSTRLPFLTGTFVPILLGVAIAAKDGFFNWWLAGLTLIGGAAVHIGLNIANDVFDEMSGADQANVNPTQFSGGSRVIQRGLVSLRQMMAASAAAYLVTIAIGIFLVIERSSLELLIIGAVGVFISIFYTAPPFRFVHRGLGEVTVALGFGPIMVLGAYVVQARHLSLEAGIASIPVAIMIALVLYVNEIPDRISDASVGKRTLPARFSPGVITALFLGSALAAFAVVLVAGALGVLPRATLITLLGVPLALQVYNGIRASYGNPYALMPAMARNVQMHLVVGLLLFAGYMLAIAADAVGASPLAALVLGVAHLL